MTTERLKIAFQACLDILDKQLTVAPSRITTNQNKMCGDGINHRTATAHLKFMCIEGMNLLPTDQEKAMHWLGFIQGTIWSIGWASIETIQNINAINEEQPNIPVRIQELSAVS